MLLNSKEYKYSFIIPTLNEAKLLPGLLEQICVDELKNKYKYEIILSDGGSSDSTINIAIKYVDKIKVHTEENVQNIAAGRNAGAQLAEGEILVFINGDIRFDNFERFLVFLETEFSHEKYSAMACNVKIFKEDEIFSDRIFHTIYNKYFKLLNICGIGMGRGECQIVERETFIKINGYNDNLAAGEDFDLFRRISKIGRILYSDKIAVYESPRRYRKYGYLNVSLSWFLNSVSVYFKNKSLSKVWEEVR